VTEQNKEISAHPRKGYYQVSADMNRNPSDFRFTNEDDVFINGRRSGTHEHWIEGYPMPLSFGIPPMREKPKLVVGRKNKLLDAYGLWDVYISRRAKELLCTIDPDAFEFAECDTVDRRGHRIDSYWMMRIIRVVERFDEEKSDFITHVQQNPEAQDRDTNFNISALNDIYMLPDLSENYHAFYFLKYQINFIFDDILVKAWKELRLSGWTFTPLQQPTKKEMKQRGSFYNSPYWLDRGAIK